MIFGFALKPNSKLECDKASVWGGAASAVVISEIDNSFVFPMSEELEAHARIARQSFMAYAKDHLDSKSFEVFEKKVAEKGNAFWWSADGMVAGCIVQRPDHASFAFAIGHHLAAAVEVPVEEWARELAGNTRPELVFHGGDIIQGSGARSTLDISGDMNGDIGIACSSVLEDLHAPGKGSPMFTKEKLPGGHLRFVPAEGQEAECARFGRTLATTRRDWHHSPAVWEPAHSGLVRSGR